MRQLGICNKKIKIIIPLVLFSILYINTSHALPAFPGAEGFGTQTIGGRGGRVLVINDFTDNPDTPKIGTLRHAIEEVKGPRFIIFARSGYITLKKSLTLKEPYVTMVGQSSPGMGVTIRGAEFVIKTHDVVIRYLRFRLGSSVGEMGGCNPKKTKCTKDPIHLEKASNVVFDHISASWSIDEILSGTDSQNITIQNSIISYPLNKARNNRGQLLHNEGKSHAFCSLFRGSNNLSFHHNIYAHCKERTPQISPHGKLHPSLYWANNFIYNYKYKGTKWNSSSDYGQVKIAIINNHYTTLKETADYPIQIETFDLAQDGASMEVFVQGNIGPYRETSDIDEWSLVKIDGDDFTREDIEVHSPFARPGIKIHNTQMIKSHLLSNAGARIPAIDDIDQKLLEDIKNNKGDIIEDENDIGGYPNLGYRISSHDKDQDGLPDFWEEKMGTDKNKQDSMEDLNSDGYSNLEDYLEWVLVNPNPDKEPVNNDNPNYDHKIAKMKILNGKLDAFEKKSKVKVDKKHLDLGKMTGLIFENQLSPNITIKKVHLLFTADENVEDSSKHTISILADNDPKSFSEKKKNLSKREITGKMDWPIDTWKKGNTYSSQDLKDLFLESKAKEKKSIGIIIRGDGKSRDVVSYEEDEEQAPKLIIEYILGP